MKKRSIFMSLLGSLILFSLQANGIEGIWEVQTTKDITYIENTVDGVRAKIGKQGPWYYYEKVSKREFVDKRGNSYRVDSNMELTWQSRDRSKRIKLFRVSSGRDDSFYSDSPGYRSNVTNKDYRQNDGFNDWYITDRDYYNRRNLRHSFRDRDQIVNYMVGNWENLYGERILNIRREGHHAIRVKFRRYVHGKALFIQDKRFPNVFTDRYGHKIILNPGGDILVEIPGHGNKIIRKRDW